MQIAIWNNFEDRIEAVYTFKDNEWQASEDSIEKLKDFLDEEVCLDYGKHSFITTAKKSRLLFVLKCEDYIGARYGLEVLVTDWTGFNLDKEKTINEIVD